LAATVNAAEEEVPAGLRFADPRSVPLSVNATLPLGSVLPVAAFTETVRVDVPPDAMVDGLAETLSDVETTGVATTMVTGDEADAPNAADPE